MKKNLLLIPVIVSMLIFPLNIFATPSFSTLPGNPSTQNPGISTQPGNPSTQNPDISTQPGNPSTQNPGISTQPGTSSPSEGVGGAGGSSGSGVGISGSTNYQWPSIQNGYSLRGVRITLYELSNNKATAKKSIEVFPRKYFLDYLNNNKVNFYAAQTSRFEYSRNNYNNLAYGKITNDKYSTEALPLFGEPSQQTLFNVFDPKGVAFSESLLNTYLVHLSKYIPKDVLMGNTRYYVVIEPTSLLIIAGQRFYGTAYEHAKFIKYKGVESQAHTHLRAHIYHQLPMAYYISDSTIENPDKYNFKGFLGAVGAKKLSDTAINKCKNTPGSNSCMTNQELLDYTYGVGILSYAAIVKEETENCNYSVNSNHCEDIGVSEPNSRLCTIKNSNFYSNYKDTGSIYCADSLSTNLTNFYKSLSSTIRAGSYFSMNDLKITNSMTCYIVSNSSSANLTNWHTTIKGKSGGDIYLTIGGREYKLTSTHNDNSATCASWSNGICQKATLTTEYTYSLNPLVNRYINIETMKEDINQFPTASNIDNGGPRLTVPLNYQAGTYKYNLNFNSSIFQSLKTEAVNINSVAYGNGKIYNLIYSTNKKLTDADLIFTCPFDVKKDITDEDPPKCVNLPKEKCCDKDGKVVDCPPSICTGECCDENGNEITCPGDDSEIKDIIYRPISLVNPFPGIQGNDRTPGKNWDNIVTIGGRTYSASDYYIKYNRGYDDYDLYREAEPLYVIKLDGAKIKAIREYNDYKNHNYNDFDLECDNGKYCISKFLRGRADHFNINLLDQERGTCRNITTNEESFNDCLCLKGKDC